MTDNLGRRVAAGAAWMLAFRMLDRGIGLVSIVILARLLVPGDFGLVAMATATISVVELLSSFGFDMALIQRTDAARAHFDTAWTLNLGLALLCALVVLAAALPASQFYSEPRLAPVMAWLALGTAVRGLENIGVVAFRTTLRLDLEVRLLTAKRLIGFAATVSVAYATRSYWALVFGTLASVLTGVAVSYLMHPYRPRLSLAARDDLLHFSKWVVINNVLHTASMRAADFVVGRSLGAGPLGLFNLANEVAQLPTTELSAPINRAAYPGFAQVAADPARLRRAFLDVQGVTALLAVPAACGIAAIAPLLVPLMLGEAWREASGLLPVLAISGLLVALRTSTGYLFYARGQSGLVAAVTLVRFLVLAPVLILGTERFGIAGAAWASLAAAVAMFPVTQWFMRHSVEIPWAEYWREIWRPVVVGIVMGIAVRWLVDQWSAATLPALAGAVVLGAVLYVGGVALLWIALGRPRSAEAHAAEWIAAALRRLRRRAS